MLRTLVLLLTSVALGSTNAQYFLDPDDVVKADLEAVNAHYQGIAQFKVDKDDRLITDLMDANGRYRQDIVYVEFLDASLTGYAADEQAVLLKCRASNPKCIDKELLKQNTISHTGRMNLPTPPGDTNGEQAIALLGKLVRDIQMAQRTAQGETDRRRVRKK